MQTSRLEELIDQSIRLELNVAELYRVFAETVPSDSIFWQELSSEERNHAALIRAAKDSFVKRGKFPRELVADSTELLVLGNTKVEALIEQAKASPPSRIEACKIAISLEQEVGESHYTCFMEKMPANSVETVFQQLNKDDRDHESRIRAHLGSLSPRA